MLHRSLSDQIEAVALKRKKMAFLSGPRQCGKTTLAKALLASPETYFSWDQLRFRQNWVKDPAAIATLALKEKQPRIVLDELHKNRRWKGELTPSGGGLRKLVWSWGNSVCQHLKGVEKQEND